MPYVINDNCIGSKDMSCVDVCPVDSIYESRTRLWIQPEECIDCGACESACPVSAISYVDSDHPTPDLTEAHEFFESVLPGRTEPIGSPKGAEEFGPVDTDMPRLL